MSNFAISQSQFGVERRSRRYGFRTKYAAVVVACLLASMSLVLSGCGKRKGSADAALANITKFTLTIASGRASLAVTFPKVQLDAGARIPLPKPKNAYVELGPDFESGGTLFVVSVSIIDLIQDAGANLFEFGLPDGRELYGVSRGVLPAFDFQLPKLGMGRFYLSGDIFGVFVPLPMPDVSVVVQFDMKDEKGNFLGSLFAVPKGKANGISGALFLFPLDGAF